MFNSLSRKLLGLIIATGILFILVLSSSYHLVNKQQLMHKEVSTLLEIQGAVNHLRSQLWIFLQYGDKKSLEQVEYTQTHLTKLLDDAAQKAPQLNRIKGMNASLILLIQQEKQSWGSEFNPSYQEGLEILHSRYNMIIQNMTEEILYLVSSKIKQNEVEHSEIIVSMGIKILLFSLIVGVISFIIYNRFQHGAKALKYAFFNLSRGNFNQKIKIKQDLDKEFVSLINVCDRMRESLDKFAVRRDELQSEVDKKTQTLLQKKEELAYLASHDYLSGLLNRRVLESKINNAIHQANNANVVFVIFYIDIDEFKYINDTYGHDAGDEVIKIVSSRLRDQTALSDFVGRTGGDEFVLFYDCSQHREVRLNEKIEQLKQVLQHDLLYKEALIAIKVSIGMSIFPNDADCLDELLKIADNNMYTEKKFVRGVGTE